MIRTAPPHSTEGPVSPDDPFLFSIPGAQPIDLYPYLRDGANLRILEEHLPVKLYAKDTLGYEKPTSNYFRLYRFLKKREKVGLLASEKGVQDLGLGDRPSVWWRPTLEGAQRARRAPQDLPCLRQVQNSNHFAHGAKSGANGDSPKKNVPKWLRWPSRAAPERINAIKAMNRIRTRTDHYQFVRPDPDHLHPDLVANLRPIKQAYGKYLDRINDQEIIVFDLDNPERFLLFPYRTRFNDDARARRNLDQYDAKFNEAEQFYDSAVFLTLTTDPAMHKTLWHANRHMSKAWNRFMSLVQKRERIARKDELTEARVRDLKKAGLANSQINQHIRSRKFRRWLTGQTAGKSYRPRYISVAEFQQNGLIHLHVLIFGKQWLALKESLAADWIRCGQGRIVDVCAVRRTEKGWTWTNPKQRPKDAKPGVDARDYLRKYLQKAVFDKLGFELYFACNRRFFTASRTMEPRKQARPARATPPAWTDESNLDYTPDGPEPEVPEYVRDPTKPRWRFGGAVPSGEVPRQLRHIARQCRRSYCRDPRRIDLNDGPPPVPAPWEEATALDRSARRRRRNSPILRFVPASKLPRSGAAEPEVNSATGKPFNLADFM